MAKEKVRKGRLIKVENKNKKFGANDFYFAVWVEDGNGKNERCVLFSENQIKVATERARKNKEDLTKKPALVDFFD